MDKRISRVLWGFVLLIVGLVLALNALGVTKIDVFFDGWWTLLIIIPCFIGVLTDYDKVGNLIGLLIGVFLFLSCQGILDFDLIWKLVIPVIIIIIGLKMIIGGLPGNKSSRIIKELNSNGKKLKNIYSAFSSSNINYNGEMFDGAELTALFGGVKLNLVNAVIDKDCVINATAIFGGIDIIIPDNINVKVKSTSIFGGVSQKKHRNSADNTYTIYVNGTCMFGGVDIK